MSPLVSIIIPYYKKENFIKQTVQSILSQTFKKYEIIIINDENSKLSIDLLNRIASIDKRIKLINNKRNLGAGKSRNIGIKKAKGRFIAFCDSDDLWVKDKLKYQLKYMQKYNIKFCFTSYQIINKRNISLGIIRAKKYMNFKHLLNSCDIGLSTVILNKNILSNKKYEFAPLKTKEDYVLWLKLARSGIIMRGYNKTLSKWRKTENSLSSSNIQKILDGYRVYKIYLGLGWIKSLFCLINLSLNFIMKYKNL